MLDRNDNRIEDAAAMWSSSDETVVTVNQQGLLTGISEGSVQVTARSEDAATMVTVIVQLQSESSERDALIVLYHTTGGPNWTNSTNWLSEEPLDSWYGVETSLEGKVSVLYLNENNLTGSIPSALGQLVNLEYLGLGYNELTGAIPSELGILAI